MSENVILPKPKIENLRDDRTIIYENPIGSGNIINIKFVSNNGLKVILPVSTNLTVEKLLMEYAKKVGIPWDHFEYKNKFLYNAHNLRYDSEEKLSQLGFNKGSIINVIDMSKVMG